MPPDRCPRRRRSLEPGSRRQNAGWRRRAAAAPPRRRRPATSAVRRAAEAQPVHPAPGGRAARRMNPAGQGYPPTEPPAGVAQVDEVADAALTGSRPRRLEPSQPAATTSVWKRATGISGDRRAGSLASAQTPTSPRAQAVPRDAPRRPRGRPPRARCRLRKAPDRASATAGSAPSAPGRRSLFEPTGDLPWASCRRPWQAGNSNQP